MQIQQTYQGTGGFKTRRQIVLFPEANLATCGAMIDTPDKNAQRCRAYHELKDEEELIILTNDLL